MKNLVLAVLLTLVLTACGSPAPATTPTSVPPIAVSPQPTQASSSATALPAETPALDGATLLETRCSVCHSADRPRQAKKTREQWDQTVARMIGKGAQLTEAEKTVLLDYLAKTHGP
jgi:cytochrome c5